MYVYTSLFADYKMAAASDGNRVWCGWKLLAPLPLFAALFLYCMPVLLSEWEARYGYTENSVPLSTYLMDQFRMFDANGDGCIDPLEFQDLSFQVNLVPTPNHTDLFDFVDPHIGQGSEVLFVRAEMVPLNLSSMVKFADGDSFLFGSPATLLPGLIHWRKPALPEFEYGARNFEVFFPPDTDLPLATPYHIITDNGDRLGVYMHTYHPPNPDKQGELIHTLLAQLHPNVFVYTRFGPRGAVALVRAKTDDLLDIVIRVHAEFQLSEPPNLSFWFTPAQFAGRLIVNQTSGHIHFFELSLPTDKQLNIDMEWMTATNANEVDIGFAPLLRVSSVQPSTVWAPGDASPTLSSMVDQESFNWKEAIPLSVARGILEQTMYPFKKVTYYPFLKAVSLAKEQLKEGPLDCPPILELLNNSFISSWALVKDIEDITTNLSSSAEDKKFAQLAMETYSFPVESMVIDPLESLVVSKINANDLLDSSQDTVMSAALGDPINTKYTIFLKHGLNK